MNNFVKDTAILQEDSMTHRPLLGVSPILEALGRLNQAQALQARIDRRPSLTDPEDAMDRAVQAELRARRDLVLLVVAAAEVDLNVQAKVRDDWAPEDYHVPIATHQEEDRLFLLVMAGNCGSGTSLYLASGHEIQIRPVVVDLGKAPSPTRSRRRTSARSPATKNLATTP